MYFYELKGIYKIFFGKHILGKKIYVIYVYKYKDLKSNDVINKQLLNKN